MRRTRNTSFWRANAVSDAVRRNLAREYGPPVALDARPTMIFEENMEPQTDTQKQQQVNGAVAAPNTTLDDAITATTERAARERIQTMGLEFEHNQRVAKLYALSGMFENIKGATTDQAIAQAFVKMELGKSMGFGSAESMTGIRVINGVPAVGSALRASRMKARGYDWRFLQLDEQGCSIALYRGGDPIAGVDGKPAVVSFMRADAERAKLLQKDNWMHFPKNMYFARAITNAQRWYAPEVLNPSILSEEEAMDLDTVVEETAARRTRTKTESLAERFAEEKRKSEQTIGGGGSGGAPERSADTQLVLQDWPNAFDYPVGTVINVKGTLYRATPQSTWEQMSKAPQGPQAA